MNNKIDYFWETRQFFEAMLAKVFPTFKIKYSLEGNGIFDLIILNDKIYEIKYTQTKKMGESDNHSIDKDKQFIINNIVNNLKIDDVAIFGGKYITFPVKEWIAKVEIIKKLKMPI